jgi:hypothetical protein
MGPPPRDPNSPANNFRCALVIAGDADDPDARSAAVRDALRVEHVKACLKRA